MMNGLEPELDRIVRSVWGSLLGLEVRRMSPEAVPAQFRNLVASIRIEGSRRTSVILKCPAPLARRAAGIMFRAVPEALPIEDVEDALGEIANITGGHVKSLLPERGRSALPVMAIIEDGDDRPRISGSDAVCQLAFDCEGIPFVVAVLR
jgi:chemotaxis protein CheX